MKNDIVKIRRTFYLLFGIMVIFVLLTPHLISGHILGFTQEYAESAALFLEIVIMYIFYRFYKKKMDEFVLGKVQAEKRLVHSYSYIGKTNGIIDLIKRFGGLLAHDQDKINEKEIFMALLSNMLVSVAKVDKGFIRFFNKSNFKTIKEYYLSKEIEDFSIKLSNRGLVEGNITVGDGFMVIASGYENTNIGCVICMPKINSADKQLLQSLITQTHLLFLNLHKDK